MIFRRFLLLCAPLFTVSAWGAPAPFDLAGPVLEVKVTRAGVTLPAAEVPNLAPGDQLWIKADLPTTQSAHYLMITAFLSGRGQAEAAQGQGGVSGYAASGRLSFAKASRVRFSGAPAVVATLSSMRTPP